MTPPGPAFQECTGSCHENVSALKVASSDLRLTKGLTELARIEIVTILQHFIHTMKPRDLLLLADVTLRCGMYPAGKVYISRHLAIPGFPRVTILSAGPVRTLVHCVVKHSRAPDLKSSSNVSLPFAWITGPATDPSFYQIFYKLEFAVWLHCN